MTEVLGRFTPQTFAMLRIVSGLMFMMHGTQKIFGWPGEKMSGLPPLIVAAGWIEIVGGALITIGLLTGIAAFISSGEMAFAFFMGHASKGGLNPLVNKGEVAVLYCFLFLFIAAHGAGIWSFDSILRKRSTVTASTGARRV